MIYLFLPVLVGVVVVSGWFAYHSVDFRKFLAGAFFVSGGVQVYLAAVGVAVPVFGTEIVQSPDVGWVRGAIHLGLGVVAFYFGFLQRRAQAVTLAQPAAHARSDAEIPLCTADPGLSAVTLVGRWEVRQLRTWSGCTIMPGEADHYPRIVCLIPDGQRFAIPLQWAGHNSEVGPWVLEKDSVLWQPGSRIRAPGVVKVLFQSGGYAPFSVWGCVVSGEIVEIESKG